MQRRLLVLLLLLLLAPAAGADDAGGAAAPFLRPYESGTGFVPTGAIDRCVLAALQEKGIQPSNPCSDEVFVRRVHLDLTGTLPDPALVRRFLADPTPDKRARLVDDLLASDGFVEVLTLKWGDLLRVKSEYPINLWPNGVQTYHRWIEEAVRTNRPYDAFVRDLLTSSGSNFRVPPVNFWRAVQGRSPDALAAAVALTFLGERIEAWPADRRAGFAAFFSRVAFKPTAEWKEEIVLLDPAPAPPVEAVFPDGRQVTIPEGKDPRVVFADWLLAPDNPRFARAIANRVWSWLFGYGIVHEPDDVRPDNPPSNPALLACLERELVQHGYDLRHLFRTILDSRTYQGSPVPRSADPQAARLFAVYPVRQLDAEVLIDSLCRLDGRGVDYASTVPEPFTLLPNTKRSVGLADGTITSPFLEMFGRPARDTGQESERSSEPTEAQRLFLLNASDVQQRIARSQWLQQLLARARGGRADLVHWIYLGILSRDPMPDELVTVLAYFEERGRNPRDAAIDLVWALLNSKEFLFRH